MRLSWKVTSPQRTRRPVDSGGRCRWQGGGSRGGGVEAMGSLATDEKCGGDTAQRWMACVICM